MFVVLLCVFHPVSEECLKWVMPKWQRQKEMRDKEILVEQVIRRLQSFRILSNELSISMILQGNDILVVCAALSNMKDHISVD